MWFRRARPSDDRDRMFAWSAQKMLSEQQQAMAGARRAYGLSDSPPADGPDFAPIAGVSVQRYAEICRDIHATPDGDIKMKAVAQRHGVTPDAWQEAYTGWNVRCTNNLAVAQAFTTAYRAG